MEQAGRLEDIYRTYRKDAAFYIVYVREAHPIDGDSPWRKAVPRTDPRGAAEREQVAGTCARTLGLTLPMLVDDMDDRVARAYGGYPDRLYIVGTDGRVVFRGRPGPRGFRPDEMERALRKLLEEGRRQA